MAFVKRIIIFLLLFSSLFVFQPQATFANQTNQSSSNTLLSFVEQQIPSFFTTQLHNGVHALTSLFSHLSSSVSLLSFHADHKQTHIAEQNIAVISSKNGIEWSRWQRASSGSDLVEAHACQTGSLVGGHRFDYCCSIRADFVSFTLKSVLVWPNLLQRTSQFVHVKTANTQQWDSASQADLTKKWANSGYILFYLKNYYLML